MTGPGFAEEPENESSSFLHENDVLKSLAAPKEEPRKNEKLVELISRYQLKGSGSFASESFWSEIEAIGTPLV